MSNKTDAQHPESETITFNRECAEALNPNHSIGINVYTFKYLLPPDNQCSFYLKDMHFHDSYDWAMLLVKECFNKLKKKKASDKFVIMLIVGHLETHFLLATPHQISQACLEVLKYDK